MIDAVHIQPGKPTQNPFGIFTIHFHPINGRWRKEHRKPVNFIDPGVLSIGQTHEWRSRNFAPLIGQRHWIRTCRVGRSRIQ